MQAIAASVVAIAADYRESFTIAAKTTHSEYHSLIVGIVAMRLVWSSSWKGFVFGLVKLIVAFPS